MNRGWRAVGLIVPILLVVLLSAPGAVARAPEERGLIAALQTTGDPTITICDANRSVATPYDLQIVPNDETLGGHLAHLDTPLDPARLSWPDIIPAPQDESGNSYCPVSPPAAPDDPTDPATGSITVHKIDQNGSPVAGACFNLGLVNGFMAAQGSGTCTDASGYLLIAGLTVPGTYQLAEESTPAGCVVAGDLPSVTLTAEEPDQAVTVTNTCAQSGLTPTIAPTTPATVPATASVTATATGVPGTPATVPATGRLTPATVGQAPAATVTALPTTGAGHAGGTGWAIWLGIAAAALLVSGATVARRSRR